MIKRLFSIILLGLIILTAYLYYHFDSIAHKQVEKQLTKALGVSVTVDSVFFKVFDGKFAFKGVKVANPNGYNAKHAFLVNKVDVSVDMNTIFKDLLVIKEIRIENPSVFYEIGEHGDNIRAIKKRIGNNKSNNSDTRTNSSNSKDGNTSKKKIIIHKFFFNNGIISTELQNIKKKELKIPDIYLQNIGKDQNGVTIENASDQIIREILKALSKINLRTILDEIKELPKSLPGLKERLQDEIPAKAKGLLKGIIE